MDPIFIYNNLIFDENQRFNLNFSNGDVLKGVNFLKENDYYMRMSCFIEVSNDITKLKQYDDIEKISIIANRYIRNEIDYGFDSLEIEIICDNKTYQLEINKISCSKAVDVYNFYDHLLKRKRFAIVYFPYKDFVKYGITYEKKKIRQYWRLYYKNNKQIITKTLFKKTFILVNRDSFQK